MALSTNTQSSNQVRNNAIGKAVSDAAAAAAVTFTCGFLPRAVRFYNITDRISDIWYEGMAAASSVHTVAAGTVTLEATNGITVTANGFTVTAATMVASKSFAWEAVG